MKLQIERIHLGRYWVTIFDGDQIISRVDGGSAYVMMVLTQLIFEPEHRQYILDQRKSSDQLAEEALSRLKKEAICKILPPSKL